MGMNAKGYELVNQVNEDIDISGVEIDDADSYMRWRNVFWSLKELGSGLIKDWHVEIINRTDQAMRYK